MMKLKPYPEYKDSGVEWLGKVPEHWPAKKLKRLARINPSRSESQHLRDSGELAVFLPMEKISTEGDFDSSEQLAIQQLWQGFTYFRRGDVIMAKITPCFENGKGACLDDLPTEIGFGTTELIVLRAMHHFIPQFLYRLTCLTAFRTFGAKSMTGAAGQKRVPADFVANFPMPVPSISEQRQIVRFLDAKTRLIDRFIRNKGRLIELLQEQKQAVINDCVTGKMEVRRIVDENGNSSFRLQPSSCKMRDSGIDWLGEIPEHWEVTKVKHVFECLDHRRIPLSGVERGTMKSRQYDYYGASGVIDKVEDYLFDDDLLLIAEDGANLVLRNLPLAIIARGKFWVNNHAHILKPKKGCLELLANIMESIDYRPWISGAAQPKLTGERLLNVPIAVPPVHEQHAIMEHVAPITTSLGFAISRAQRQIDLIQEYRTRLIADVVTGKVDVRGIPVEDVAED